MKRLLFSVLLLLLLFPLLTHPIISQNEGNEVLDLQKQIQELEEKLDELGKKRTSLASEISYMNGQIRITTLKIDQTEEQIKMLTEKIGRLEVSLDRLASLLNERIVETYKIVEIDSLALFLSSDDFSDFVSRYKYLKMIQVNDRRLLYAMETTRTDYDDQREEEKMLMEKLEKQQILLARQKRDKEYLLEVTKNDEKRYQELLAKARAELEAIRAVLAGRGEETEIGPVSTGERIASIIQGPSCNSSGPHLHFMVVQEGNPLSPFDYLKGDISYENCSGSSCGSDDSDPFSPHGDWDWPADPPIEFTQGYGSTWAIQHTWVGRIYTFHNGIDFNSPSSGVKAVKPGVLFWGSYTTSQGCQLNYVRVDHDDSNLETYYVHVN